MKGYIGITSKEWFTYLSGINPMNEVNFWRKNTRNFNVLKKGEPFFFLVKNSKGIKGERAVLGKATYQEFKVLSVEDAWNKYSTNNGSKDKESFINKMESMFGTNIDKDKIGCIILYDFKVFYNQVYLSDINIEFGNSIVSGKGIEDKEINGIIQYGLGTIRDVMKRITEVDSLDLTEDDIGFPEGRLILKQHLVRERNTKVSKLAKQQYLKEHNKLVCEACNFDFTAIYGDIGEGYIEAHHTKPLTEMNENELTKIEDIALVCSNCHRMLHRKRPWLSITQLKKLLI